MSQNVEIVKRAIDAFNRGDLDGYGDLYTPESGRTLRVARSGSGRRPREGTAAPVYCQ